MLKLTDKLEEIRILLENEIQNAERIALQSLFGAYMRRIFNEGKATDETQIGEYSKKPMLTGSKNFRTAGSAKSFFSKKNEWLSNIAVNQYYNLPYEEDYFVEWLLHLVFGRARF